MPARPLASEPGNSSNSFWRKSFPEIIEYKEAKHVFSCGKELLTRWLTGQPSLGENVEETAPASAFKFMKWDGAQSKDRKSRKHIEDGWGRNLFFNARRIPTRAVVTTLLLVGGKLHEL